MKYPWVSMTYSFAKNVENKISLYCRHYDYLFLS